MEDGNRTGLCQLLLVFLVVVLLVLPDITSIVSLLHYLGFQDKCLCYGAFACETTAECSISGNNSVNLLQA